MRGRHPERRLERAVDVALQLRAGERILAAVSGGSDSLALAALAARAAAAAGAVLSIGHVNHGVRAESDRDESVVLAVAGALRVPVHVARLEPGPADEARLREARYAALTEFARRTGAGRVLTAHHAEDQTETVLLALFRGTGPNALGMPSRRTLAPGVTLERPLLAFEKAELARYALGCGLPVALDAGNADPDYRRNALRAALEELRPRFPRLDAAVARYAALAAEAAAATPRSLLRASLRRALHESFEHHDVTFERFDAVARAIDEGRPGRHFLRRGLEAVVEPRSPERRA